MTEKQPESETITAMGQITIEAEKIGLILMRNGASSDQAAKAANEVLEYLRKTVTEQVKRRVN